MLKKRKERIIIIINKIKTKCNKNNLLSLLTLNAFHRSEQEL